MFSFPPNETREGGRVLAIAVDFVPGVHYFENIHQVSSIVDNLIQLHTKQHVHGDIRALNLLVQGNTAEFIDFDFCGTENEVKYPPGYNDILKDGLREGKANQLITRHDDFMALQSVFDLHLPHDDSTGEEEQAWKRLFRHSESLSQLEKELKEFPYKELWPVKEKRFEKFFNNLRQHEGTTTKEMLELPNASTPDRFPQCDG